MENLLLFPIQKIDARRTNILRSPKKNGSSLRDSIPYLKELGVTILENHQPIQFTTNINEHIHRWAPYVQGFSASFVQSIIDNYRLDYKKPIILDPFAGCGTVLVQAKLNNCESYGTELNPLLQFIADTKLNCWDVSPAYLSRIYHNLSRNKKSPSPIFLKSEKHFKKGVLNNLEILKGGIDNFNPKNVQEQKIKNLLLLAFSSILIDCSNLKRSPCLGYCKNRRIVDTAPFLLMERKIGDIVNDLNLIRSQYSNFINVQSKIFLANSMDFRHAKKFDLVITSPPYMNGMDYVMNYKIEMGWLGFAGNHEHLKRVKDSMVVCDNVSKGLIRNFSRLPDTYKSDWIEKIKARIGKNIAARGSYRRGDMPYIVHKYFDDMSKVFKNVVPSIKKGGRFILVVGDSLIADVYVPTDLIIARMGSELGMDVEKIEKARTRRSGQVRSYKLRETIISLIKRKG